MKQKKPIYRILALFLLISLQLSCSEDNYQDAFNSNNSKSIKKTTINFDEIKNNKKITNKLKDFNDKKRSFKENNRSIYNAEYDFFINTDNIIMAEGDFGTSYTFSIDRNFDYDYLENLVIQITNDNQHVTANVIVYTLTESEKNIVQNGGTISNIVSKTRVYPLDNFIISSITSKIFYEPDHDGSPTIYVFEDGSCGVIDHIDDLGDGEVMIYFTPVNCETSGGDGNVDSGAGNSISFDNTSDGNGNPSNYTPGNITYGSGGGGIGVFTSMNPITNSMEYQVVKDFRKQLNTAQITWWTNPNNADAVQSISDYLIHIVADPILAEELIDLAIENNATFNFDNTIDPANSLNFDNVEDFQDYLDNIPTDGFDIELEDNMQTNQKIAKCKFQNGAYGIQVKIKQNMNPYSVADVTSNKYGFSILLDWEQTDYSVNITGSYVFIDIYGVQTTGITIDGIGLAYEDNFHYKITINKNSGTIISSTIIND